MKNTVISIKNLRKSYGDYVAVENLSFEAEESTCVGLLGPNGAGKTTTMKIIYGKAEFDKNSDTQIDIFGYSPLRDSLQIKTISGIVPQDNNLDMELNVFENLYIYSKFYGIPSKEAKIRIKELLEFMELEEKAKSNVRELSGGMQRRLTIARALLNNPKLLILDEPTTGLDPQVRHLIWNKLRKLKEQNVTILITTHYMEEAFQICDRIIIMDKGKKIIEGNPRKLLQDNIEQYVMEIPHMQNFSCSIDVKNDATYRLEEHNDTMFLYAKDLDSLKKVENCMKSSEYYIRLANLEDLFLKVTGRSLNELQ